mgnify:FL=1
MLSQGHMVAPLYHYTSQVFLSFGNSGSLEEWKNCHNVMVEADSAMWCHNAVKTDASCARSTQK